MIIKKMDSKQEEIAGEKEGCKEFIRRSNDNPAPFRVSRLGLRYFGPNLHGIWT
jgi:hypothetical protein